MGSKALSTVVIVIACILMLPIAIGICGGFFGLIVGIFGAIFGLVSGIFGAIFGAIGSVFGAFFNGGFVTIAVVIIAIVLLRRDNKRA